MISTSQKPSPKLKKVLKNKNTIKIPSEIKYIRKVSSEILDSLSQYGLSEDALFDIRLCVEEILCNAIKHGNPINKKSEVKINYRIKDGLFTIEIEDSGAGFDPNKVPDPTHEDKILKGGGRGVYLVQRLMDKVEYNDKGNKVKLTKRI